MWTAKRFNAACQTLEYLCSKKLLDFINGENY